jgi:hypothetical protein
LLKFKAEGGGGRFDSKGINPNEATAWAQGDCGHGEELFQEATEIGNGNAFAEWRVGDHEADAGWTPVGDGGEFTKIACDEIGADAREEGSGPVGASGGGGVGAEIGSQNTADAGQADAFDEFESRSAERVPDSLLGKGTCEAGHGGGEGRVGGSRNIL